MQELLERAAAASPDSPSTVEVVDVLAGHVVHIARTRGWPVLTTGPDRLRRLDTTIEIQML